ncbi:unnamed protein product [Nesidiocoris tenuis]|uniref:Uncharacterized protein n=1 Tax=Nesidiocoris tenuis TaxID=355587 RepID=A0A6H5HDR9_9HEMI|nr:unnamed protein product [Nesidiocoris tenuis]
MGMEKCEDESMLSKSDGQGFSVQITLEHFPSQSGPSRVTMLANLSNVIFKKNKNKMNESLIKQTNKTLGFFQESECRHEVNRFVRQLLSYVICPTHPSADYLVTHKALRCGQLVVQKGARVSTATMDDGASARREIHSNLAGIAPSSPSRLPTILIK